MSTAPSRRRAVLATAALIVSAVLSASAATARPDGGPAKVQPHGAASDTSGYPCYSHRDAVADGELHFPVSLCHPLRSTSSS
ncbi:hypothetical protein [Aeromicrobium terrae]|uniref:Secreted protein n=1 Tax=Aeromicrobium terrae TaxID=2498846 RepID=A0A5C8NGC2_9ACTN|nr:hypothetical protein [Aeromicrobium terrae]TXL58011.1 hypothetical protein FHP06_11820 [Aeromicrobium terrae]